MPGNSDWRFDGPPNFRKRGRDSPAGSAGVETAGLTTGLIKSGRAHSGFDALIMRA